MVNLGRVVIVAGLTLAAGLPCFGEGCPQRADYDRAVCLYRTGNLAAASSEFERVSERIEPAPETIRSMYFLARIRMKEGEWQEANDMLIEIWKRSPVFYRSWSCDYLLGECRRALERP